MTRDDDDTPAPIKPLEIGLFLVLGLLPLLLIYAFASHGMQDTQGAKAEAWRRAFMDECLGQLEDRKACRAIVDERYQACFKTLADSQGHFPDRAAATACISGRTDGKYRPSKPQAP